MGFAQAAASGEAERKPPRTSSMRFRDKLQETEHAFIASETGAPEDSLKLVPGACLFRRYGASI